MDKSNKVKKAIPEFTLSKRGMLLFILPVLSVTILLFIPALRNGFTNWDDTLYVVSNPLLKDLSLNGLKAIFSTPVVSNYHPLTILSLAVNYQFADLKPWSYHLTGILLHAINTGLVFWFIMLLSRRNFWVSAISALLFGIHPMHVESVAWISERKDLLYTLFYLGALIVYVRYIQEKKVRLLVLVTGLGALSLLCKPAAIVLPLSLLLLDVYLKRKWSWKWIIEKTPLLVLCGILAYYTISIQSERAIASIESHSVVERICYAGFGLIWYLVKFIYPYPLSALHPFPKEIPVTYYMATLASVLGLLYLIWKVKNRNYLFGFGFYVANLLLVLQLVSIGNAVVAERYTYVPYIGLIFLLCTEMYTVLSAMKRKYKPILLGIGGLWIVGLMALTWMRIPVWKTSDTLWADVLKKYPESTRAWTNKGLHYYDQKDWPKAIEHLSKALEYDPGYANALEWRSRAYLESGENSNALADAEVFRNKFPDKQEALYLLARSYAASERNEEALEAYNQLLLVAPNVAQYWDNRGVLLFNKLRRYGDAKKDFEVAIHLNPNNGMYYLNLSRCFYLINDMPKAKENAQRALARGTRIDPSFAKLIGLQ